ncbi:MAG: toxin glutamine deamidase domain-containing protein [Proteobacteria bacterium]|nr:toxin glutamine deamidase domain-containing protein [Pseudomonadota bacterium]
MTDGGQAVYTIPLVVPAGTAGLTPSLALQYQSGAGLGLLGRGWRLTGLSQIARCPRSFVHSASGFPEAIADASSDQLCLDGAPLVAVSGVYGQSGTEYRTEAESFSRIVSAGSSALGPDGFEVRTRDGRILRYGFRDDAREAADNGIRRQWMLAEISDRNGNLIEMSYARECRSDDWIVDCTFKAPSEIRYGIYRDVGRGAGKRQAADRRIQFVYGDREDERTVLWYGDRRLEWRKLEAVQTYVNGSMEREYQLEYGYQNQTTVLETVQECADGACRTAATITYERYARGFDRLVRTTNRVSYGFGTRNTAELTVPLVADVDGDGNGDLLRASDDGDTDAHGNPAFRLNVRYGNMSRGQLARTITDGLGQRISIRYDALGRDGQRTYKSQRLSCPDRTLCLRRVGPLVSSYRITALRDVHAGIGDLVRTHDFSYRNARVGWYGRGALGFERRVEVVWDGADELLYATTRTFDNSTYVAEVGNTGVSHWYPYAGRLQKSETRLPVSPSRLSGFERRPVTTYSVQNWQIRQSDAGRPFVVAEHVRTQQHDEEPILIFDPVDQILSTIDTHVVVAEYGNTTQRHVTWSNGNGERIEDLRVDTDFEVSSTRAQEWLVSLPDAMTTTRTRQGRTQTVTETYRYWPATSNGPKPGWLLASVETRATAPRARTKSSFGYDEYGNVTTTTHHDATGNERTETTYYDSRGFAPTSLENAEGHRYEFAYDPVYRQLQTFRDPNGIVVQHGYDGFGRHRKTAAPGYVATTSYAARPGSPDLANMQFAVTTTVAGRGTTRTEFDALGRQIRTHGTGYRGKAVAKDFTYNPAGRLDAVSEPFVLGSTGSSTHWTRYRYDPAGRMIRQERPDDNAAGGVAVTTFARGLPGELSSASAWRSSVRAVATTVIRSSNPLDNERTLVFDHRGDIVATVDADGNVTQHEYDPSGPLRALWDPAGNLTSVDYDGLGRPWRLVSPNAGTVTVEYNDFGELTSSTDNASNRAYYTYDRIGRPVRKDDRSGTTHWHYDQGTGAVGRLSATMSPDCHRTAYDYAPAWGSSVIAGALVRSRLFVGSESFDLGYQYDAHGRAVRIDYPALVSGGSGSGFAVRNGYDSAGNLVSVDEVFDDALDVRRLWTLIDDDDGHRIHVEQLGHAITTTRSYQPRSGRLESLHSQTGGTVLQHLTYGYDAAGRVRSTIDAVEPASSRIYRYDALDRLEKVFQAVENDSQRIGALVRELSYDPTGNILAQTGIGDYRYDVARPHAVLSAGANVYEYDANGNQILRIGPDVAGGRQRIEYTPFDLPRRVYVGTSPTATRFGYDAREQRVVKAGSNGTTIYVDNLYERTTTSAGTTHLYHVMAPTGHIATIRRSTGLPETDETRFLLADRLGSARTITDSDGNVVVRQRFTAFGKRETALDASAGNRGFTGHEHDQDLGLGLVNMRGRMYDPAIGRFLSIDPILHTPFATQGTNAYSYVYNNPLSFRDPSGLSPDKVKVIDFSDCPTVIVAGADEVPDEPCPPKSGPSGNGASASGTSGSQGTTGSGHRTRPGSAETTAHQPGAAGTGDGEPGGGHGHPSTATGRPGGSPHGVSYGKEGSAENVPLFAGLGLFNTALGKWLSSFKVKASTKAALDGASLLAAVFTGVTSFVAKLAQKAVRAGAKALGGAFRRFRRPSASRGVAGSGRPLATAINPLRGTTNCVNCAVALDATLAGRWAQAVNSRPVKSLSQIPKIFGKTGFDASFSSLGGVRTALANAGAGARGVVVGMNGSAGHAFNVVNKGGVVRFLDGQGAGVSLSGFKKFHLIITSP